MGESMKTLLGIFACMLLCVSLVNCANWVAAAQERNETHRRNETRYEYKNSQNHDHHKKH